MTVIDRPTTSVDRRVTLRGADGPGAPEPLPCRCGALPPAGYQWHLVGSHRRCPDCA